MHRVSAVPPLVSTLISGLLLLAAPLAVTAQEAAPRSHTAGLVLNLHLQGGSLTTDGGSDSGGGAGLLFGYGVSRKVLIFSQIDAAEVEVSDEQLVGSYGLVHGDLGVRYSFASETKAFIPYIVGAFTGLWAGAEVGGRDFRLKGGGLRLGGGFGYHFIPQLALDVGLSFTFGTFNDLEIESVTLDIDDTKANTSRLDVGLSWYPQA